jgi:hypothetical protein
VHDHRLVSIVKMAIVLDGVLFCVFCGQEDSMQRIFINKCVLFKVGSVCRVKQFITGLRNSLKDVQKSQMMPDQDSLLRL